MFNPYFAIAGGVALLAVAGGSFVKGEQYANARHDQAQLGQLVQALADRDAKQKTIDALETKNSQLERDRQTVVRSITREIPTIITRPVYRNVCVDSDGVRLLDRAQGAANGDPGGHPGAPAGQAGPGAGNPAHD
jgi:uncharacterized protein (DUF58 family)